MPSRTDGHELRRTGRLLIGLCALALALQGIAMLVVDLPGCIEAGDGARRRTSMSPMITRKDRATC